MAEAWLDAMIEEIAQHENKLKNMKRAANTFFTARGEEAPFPDVDADDGSASMKLRADEYYGKAFATAARSFLLRRNKGALPAEEIVRGLEQGGYDFDGNGWKPSDRLRIAAVSMAKNTAQFHRLPNGMFGLTEWYPDAKKKTSKKGEIEAEGDGKENAVSE